MSETIVAGIVVAVAAAIIGVLVWSVQRIVGRIDKIGDALTALATRVTVIETKQDASVALAARADRVQRATAEKVGADLPPGLTDTFDPSRRPRPA